MRRHIVLWGTLGVLAAASIVVIALLLASAASGNPHDTDQVTFSGPWQAKLNDATLNAVISGDGIEIHWVTSQTDAIYWKGTFPVPEHVTHGSVLTITSVGDTAAMENSLLASQNKTKDFTFDNGKLTFKMTVMGVTQTVALEQQNPGV
jgi:hypothetical protein